MFLQEFNSTQLQRESAMVFKAAYRKPVRVTRQGDHGVVVMSEREYKKLLKEANR